MVVCAAAVWRCLARQSAPEPFEGQNNSSGGVRGDGGIRPIDGLRKVKSAVGGLGGWFRKDFPVGGSEAVLLHLRAPATMGRGCSRLQRPFLDQQSPISELLATVRSASCDNRRQAGLLRLFASWPNRRIESGCPPYCSMIPDLSAKDRELQQRREAGEARQNQVPRRYRVMSELSIRNDRFTSARLIVVLPSHQYGSGSTTTPWEMKGCTLVAFLVVLWAVTPLASGPTSPSLSPLIPGMESVPRTRTSPGGLS